MLKLPFKLKVRKALKEKEPYSNGLSDSQAKEYRILTFFEDVLPRLNEIFSEFKNFAFELTNYLARILHLSFLRFEMGKSLFAAILYRQRGKYAKRFVHSGMAGLAALGVMIAPVIAKEFPGRTLDPWDIPSPSSVLSASVEETGISTDISSKPRDKIIEYEVQEGDTVSGVADKFAVSQDTILWQNDLSARDRIKPGQTLEILPVSGISHKVAKGDTVYSIAKKYDSSPQAVVDFPFNTFVNDETFELAIGQSIIVPDGIKPEERPTAPRTRRITPDAGTVVASGAFVWPASGTISQNFVWYHKGIDIANRAAPDILAADAGTVITAGWPDNYGYGNRVVIDHGNGYRTLYGHLSRIYVTPGQTVVRGAAVGKMGSTGRSTGIHLHFEVTKEGAYLNPLSVLR
ncbi:MAG: Peptidase M23 family protein [Candidatus Woesebacteria bacterium GW2011_GWB1_39_12]|uniref:Peptidase M23 family protein n=2 Tax=Candidatus Woeseibacteriota TaxID=1752722 RepID=A0A0G0M4Q5_9BACT|nr:MAG: Peptidase M23 family protein [Candidatus Woesebacteria bacterium GW2011_GWA1_39_12]KKR01086.1 MAG: Peptidase M23 family protein [Candidatus Woesebacteria bacterium GW2011_GWB1_39_12]